MLNDWVAAQSQVHFAAVGIMDPDLVRCQLQDAVLCSCSALETLLCCTKQPQLHTNGPADSRPVDSQVEHPT